MVQTDVAAEVNQIRLDSEIRTWTISRKWRGLAATSTGERMIDLRDCPHRNRQHAVGRSRNSHFAFVDLASWIFQQRRLLVVAGGDDEGHAILLLKIVELHGKITELVEPAHLIAAK